MGSAEQPVVFIFKLRRNIVLEGDLLLAKMELQSLLAGPVHEISSLVSLHREFQELAELQGVETFTSHARETGTQAYRGTGALTLLPQLMRKLTFFQRIYCFVPRSSFVEIEDLNQLYADPFISLSTFDRRWVLQAVPRYVLFELAGFIAKRTGSPYDCQRVLQEAYACFLRQSDSYSPEVDEFLKSLKVHAPLSHDLHSYKAKFFPRLARSLLNSCSTHTGLHPQRVLDPFVGSGTTLLEAATLGLRSIGVDIDPLSVMISNAKLALLQIDPSLLHHEAERIEKIIVSEGAAEHLETDSEEDTPPFPAWMLKNRRMSSELCREFSRDTQRLLSIISTCDPVVHNVMRVLLSDAICHKIRMRFLGTGVGRFSLNVSQTSLERLFLRGLRQAVKVSAACGWLRDILGFEIAYGEAVVGDARCLRTGKDTYDIFLTSPPYLPASSGRESYARAHAPSLIALGMKDPFSVEDLADGAVGSMYGSEEETGELTSCEREAVEWLRQDTLRSIKAEPSSRYFLDMRRFFQEMHRTLAPGARGVVVSSKQSAFYRFSTRESLYVVPCAEILADEAQRAGFNVWGMHDLQLRKANRNARPRSLDDYYETLIMLRKAGE